MRTLAVPNIAEFNESTRRGAFAPAERASWLRASDDLADMGAFWGTDNVLLAPTGVRRAWLDDVCEAMGWTTHVVEPPPRTGRLVADALADPVTLRRLAELLGEHAALAPWGVTNDVLQLDAALRTLGVRTEVDAPAIEDLWSVRYLDSKLALSDLAASVPEIKAPPSYTALSYDHLMGLVGAMAAMRRPFVVKSNVGVGGFGTFIAPSVSTAGEGAAAIHALVEAMDDEPIFREGPFLVQDYVTPAEWTLRPTFDGIVRGVDDVESVGVGGMLVDGASYRGVVVGEVPLSAAVVAETMNVGRAVGHAASQLGFRGWYDVDFVLSESGQLFATEINARRTSPVHAFAALARWRADDPTVRCVLADDHIPVGGARPATWDDIAHAFHALRASGIRCAATIVRTLASLTPTVGAVIGTASYADAQVVLQELRERLARQDAPARATAR